MAERGHAPQPHRPDQAHVDRGGGDHQPLVGADVGRGAGAADVLLAGLQRERESGLAVHVHGAAHQPARQLAHQRLPAGEKAEVRPARTERHAQGLPLAAGDRSPLPAPFAGGLEQPQRHGVDHGYGQRAVVRGPVRHRVHRFQDAEDVGLGHHHGGDVLAGMIVQGAGIGLSAGRIVRQVDEVDPLGGRDGLEHGPVVGMQRAGNQDAPGG